MRVIVAFFVSAAFLGSIAGAVEKPRYEVVAENDSAHQVHIGIRDGYHSLNIAMEAKSTDSRDYETSFTTIGVSILCSTRYVHHALSIQPSRKVIRVIVDANCGEHVSNK